MFRGTIIFQNTIVCYKLLPDVTQCFQVLQYTNRCYLLQIDAIKRCYEKLSSVTTFESAVTCIRQMLHNAFRCYNTLNDVTYFRQMHSNDVSLCYQVCIGCYLHQTDVTQCFLVLQNANRCYILQTDTIKRCYTKLLSVTKFVSDVTCIGQMLHDAIITDWRLTCVTYCYQVLHNAIRRSLMLIVDTYC